jgi:hypothetical protein
LKSKAWNSIFGFSAVSPRIPQMLPKKYRLFLLSNTDAIHIERFEQNTGPLSTVISINVSNKFIFRLK